MTFCATGADENDLGAQRGCGFALDGRSVVGHDDDRFHAQRASGVGYALRVVAAGVGDDAALAVDFRKRGDLVVGSAEFESADGLLVFGFEKEPAGRVGGMEFDQAGAGGDALEAGAGFLDVGESDGVH